MLGEKKTKLNVYWFLPLRGQKGYDGRDGLTSWKWESFPSSSEVRLRTRAALLTKQLQKQRQWQHKQKNHLN